MSLFLAGIILLLNIWGGKRAGSVITDPAKEMADVHKAMKMLKALERRWHTAGRLWLVLRCIIFLRTYYIDTLPRDIMYELAEVGDLPLPQPSPQPSNKRDRNSENKLVNSSGPESSPSPASEPRHFAGSRRVGEAKARQTSRSNSSLSPTPQVHQVLDTPPPPSLPQASMYSASSSIIDSTPVPVPQHAQRITLPVNGFSMGNASYGAGPSTSHGQMNNLQLQTGQPLDMDPILSMQSMMYDQALANLSASLMPQASPTAQQQQTSQTSGPQFVHPPDENLDEWLRMASLGAGAFSLDATAETASQSMWSAGPNGFE